MGSTQSEGANLNRILKRATEKALREAKALGLPITYLENGKIIKELPDGRKVVLRDLKKTEPSITIKKGTILHAKK